MIKRKLLVVALSLAMVVGMSTTAFADPQEETTEAAATEQSDTFSTLKEHATDGTEQGSKDGAVIGETEEFKRDGVNYKGNTDFYIKVDKDATDDTVTIKDPVDIPVDPKGGVCHYEIEWTIERESQLKVTVPLYVCMYGYGGDGTVITPKEDSYQLKNESTYSDTEKVTKITPYYKVTKIPSGEEYVTEETTQEYIEELKKTGGYQNATPEKQSQLLAGVNSKAVYQTYINALKEKIGSIKEEEQTGDYGYYVIKDTTNEEKDTYDIIKLSDCAQHNSTNGTCEKGDYFVEGKSVTEVTIGQETYATDKSSKEQTVLTAAKEGTYLPVNVPTIQTKATWALKSVEEMNNLKAKELVMKVNGLDLSKVDEGNSFGESNTLDITDLKWVVPAATGVDEPGTLDLPIEAAIAGGNVNDEGCVPVVQVIYTISPAFDNGDLSKRYGVQKPPPSDES